ncbi:MAG: hypothetical protein H0X02_05060, partial [Nitrosomonas sp.]|nr:hypothetical protein [Nitrosomonas sp.]
MTQAPKKKTFQEMFFPSEEPANYVEDPAKFATAIQKDGTIASKSSTAKLTYDPKTAKSVVENKAIGVDIEHKGDPVQAPVVIPPKVEAPKPQGPYVPMGPQAQEIAATKAQSAPEQKDDSFPWDRALIGATPLLVGLLTGNKLEGVQASANYLTTEEGGRFEREKDFNYKLAEMKAKRDLAGTSGKPNFNKTEVLNTETGKEEIWSTLNGKRYEFLGLKAADNKSAKPA